MKDYIESWHIRWGEKSEKRTRKKIMADLNTHLTLQKHRQENAASKAAHLASLQPPDPKPIISNDMSSSRRSINTPKDNKPGASFRTHTETSSTSSTLDVSRDQGEDSHKNFDFRQSYAHRTSRDFQREEEEGKRQEIQENHRKWYEDCRQKTVHDAAALASVQTSRPRPIIANGMSSARTAASHSKDRKPSASSRTRPRVSPIKSTQDALRVRSAEAGHTTRERKTVVEQSPSIYYSRRLDYNFEDSTTPSGSRPCSHCGNKNRKPHYIDAACQPDASLTAAGSANKQRSSSGEDVAKEFGFWI